MASSKTKKKKNSCLNHHNDTTKDNKTQTHPYQSPKSNIKPKFHSCGLKKTHLLGRASIHTPRLRKEKVEERKCFEIELSDSSKNNLGDNGGGGGSREFFLILFYLFFGVVGACSVVARNMFPGGG